MRDKRNALFRLFLLCIMAVSLVLCGWEHCRKLQQKEQQQDLILIKEKALAEEEPEDKAETAGREEPEDKAETAAGEEPESMEESDCGKAPDTEQGVPLMLEKYRELYGQNSDLAGWLAIEGTAIDYPVMQCDDNEYYLHHDFYGQDSKYGCLYVKDMADFAAGTNFIIYGHNMKDGSMFGDLDLYQKESFYREHPAISFDTLYEERVYDIVAVFRSQVYKEEEDVFKYYQFYQADTPEEFEYFYTNIKELSLYDTGVTAEYGDRFLTLSTCAYHVEDGRFVVVAKLKE